MLRVASVLIASTVLFGGVAEAAQGGSYKTKADEKAGRLTPGRPAAAPRAEAPNAGGEDCGSATPIASLPFTDSDDTTGNADDNSDLPDGCSDYTMTAGPDVIYTFTAGPGNNIAFNVTPTNAIYDVAFYILGTCGNSATCVIGADACLADGQPQLPDCTDGDGDEDIPAALDRFSPGTHAIYVDSFYAAGVPCVPQGNNLCGAGPYTLNVTGVLPADLIDMRIE